MQIVNINEVKPNPKNPRIIKDEKFKKLVKSIQEFPDMLNKRPLITFTDKDGKYVVLGGNMRLKALKELNYKEVPIILADEWTEEQKAEFLIKDNVGFGEWDWDSLANEWDSEKLNTWGLEVPIFSNDINLDDFFEEDNQLNEKEETFDIILEYTEEEYHEVIELFEKQSGSREKIVLELLKKL
jgi:ParB-like chromosome segregation protein Spo0J